MCATASRVSSFQARHRFRVRDRAPGEVRQVTALRAEHHLDSAGHRDRVEPAGGGREVGDRVRDVARHPQQPAWLYLALAVADTVRLVDVSGAGMNVSEREPRWPLEPAAFRHIL